MSPTRSRSETSHSANLRSSIRCPFHAIYDRADSGSEAAALACPLVERILAIGAVGAELTEFSISRIRAGPIGVSVMWTPNPSSACSIALMIAAAAGITPHSPTPFTPSGLRGDGETWLISSIGGSSVALGSR